MGRHHPHHAPSNYSRDPAALGRRPPEPTEGKAHVNKEQGANELKML